MITGGASAVYGSDAMAGVVNFRLRQHFHGIQLSYQHGATTSGYGPENSISVLMGGNFDHNKGNAVVDLEYNERGAITGADSSFFSNPLIFTRGVARGPEGIFNAGELGGTIPVVGRQCGPRPVSGHDPGHRRRFRQLSAATSASTATARCSRSADPGNCAQNYRGPIGKIPGLAITPDCSQGDLLSRTVLLRADAAAALQSLLAPDVQHQRQRPGVRDRSTSCIRTSKDVNAAGYVGPGKFIYIPTNNPFVYDNADLSSILNAAGVPVGAGVGTSHTINMEDWLTAMGPRVESFLYNDYQFTTGLKGGIGDTSLSWNVFGSYGQTYMENDETHNVNLPAIESIVYGTANYIGSDGSTCQGYAWNPLGGHALSKGCLEYATGTAKNDNLLTQKYLEADLSGNLWKLPEGRPEVRPRRRLSRRQLRLPGGPVAEPGVQREPVAVPRRTSSRRPTT